MRKWLIELRGERSQQSVADEIGISQSAVASIEAGIRNPSVEMAKKIAGALGFAWTRFFEDQESA